MKRPKIKILNSSSFAVHHKDHLEALESFADIERVNVDINAKDEEIIERLKGSNGIIASVTPKISGFVLSSLEELVFIARHGIGCDNVDLETATKLGIMVSRVDGPVEKNAVAEHAVALMLSSARYVTRGFESVKNSKWSERANYIGLELNAKKVGLIGLGNIGSRVSEILTHGFRSEVLAYDPYIEQSAFAKYGAKSCSLDELISSCDLISFHCPLTEETKRMIGESQFKSMKKGAMLFNTCRGELLDEKALISSLGDGSLRAYGTDVVEGEPIDGEHPILKLPNVIVLPHLGGYTDESLRGMGDTMVNDSISVFVNNTVPGVLANPKVLEQEYRKWV